MSVARKARMKRKSGDLSIALYTVAREFQSRVSGKKKKKKPKRNALESVTGMERKKNGVEEKGRNSRMVIRRRWCLGGS